MTVPGPSRIYLAQVTKVLTDSNLFYNWQYFKVYVTLYINSFGLKLDIAVLFSVVNLVVTN
jgi:hypothetical protein